MSTVRVAGRTGSLPTVVLSGLALVLVVAAIAGGIAMGGPPPDLAVVLLFAVAMFAGELLRIAGPRGQYSAPVASAAALAFALAAEVGGRELHYGAPMVVLTCAGSILAAEIVLRVAGRAPGSIAGYAVRLVVVALTATAFREIPISQGRTAVELAITRTVDRWQLALIMLALVVLVEGIGLLLRSWVNADASRGWWRALGDEAYRTTAVSLAADSTAVVVALGMRSLGVIAIVVFLLPLVLMRMAIRNQQSARRARRQAVAALSTMTDLAGYTASGHSGRVAALAGQVGRQLRLTERALEDLDGAALLHDIGQVSLRSPLPGGSTVELAPVDQQQIADDGAAIVLRTEALDDVARIIREHPTPYRYVREQGLPLSTEARILKVCNAFDDLSGGHQDARDAALERIMLGLGYEYDPEVVDALQRVTERVGAARG
ncbi:HD-GYP domain-containing protein [Dermacoccaceae bacterium W4C1]